MSSIRGLGSNTPLNTQSEVSSQVAAGSITGTSSTDRVATGPLAGLSAKWKPTSLTDAHAFSIRPGVARYARIGGSTVPGDAPYKLGAPMTKEHEAELQATSKVAKVAPQDLKHYRLDFKEGRIVDATGKNLDTRSAAATNRNRIAGRAIYVMDHYGNFYATNNHKEGKFHHSSFLGGASVACAGEIEVHDGIVKVITNKSGHYLPERSHLAQAVTSLQLHGVKVTSNQITFEK